MKVSICPLSYSQVWCGLLGTGPDGTQLNSSYNTRSDPRYLAALGQVVIMFLKIVPKGVLVFFPSYGLLNSTREHWQQSGIWSRIDSVKKIMVEPQRKDALPATMRGGSKVITRGHFKLIGMIQNTTMRLSPEEVPASWPCVEARWPRV